MGGFDQCVRKIQDIGGTQGKPRLGGMYKPDKNTVY